MASASGSSCTKAKQTNLPSTKQVNHSRLVLIVINYQDYDLCKASLKCSDLVSERQKRQNTNESEQRNCSGKQVDLSLAPFFHIFCCIWSNLAKPVMSALTVLLILSFSLCSSVGDGLSLIFTKQKCIKVHWTKHPFKVTTAGASRMAMASAVFYKQCLLSMFQICWLQLTLHKIW